MRIDVNVNCPKCKRPFQTQIIPGPAVIVRCNSCQHPFTMQNDQIIDEGELQKQRQRPAHKADEEIWELSADEEQESSSPKKKFESLDDIMNDFVEEKNNGQEKQAEEVVQKKHPEQEFIPGLSKASPMLERYAELATQQQFQELVQQADEAVPDLPDFQFELEEAAVSDQIFESQPHLDMPSPELTASSKKASSAFDSQGALKGQVKDVDSLLEEFVGSKSDHLSSQSLFYIRREGQEYGPFEEGEILKLLDDRKLTGRTEARSVHGEEWKPLQEIYDFRGTIELLEKVKIRKGWEGRRKKTAPPKHKQPEQSKEKQEPPQKQEPSKKQDAPKATGSDTAKPVETKSQNKKIPKPKKPNKFKKVQLVALLILLLLGVGGYYFLFSDTGDEDGFGSKFKAKASPLVQSDNIRQYARIFKQLKTVQEGKDFIALQAKVRFIYYFLDSHGDDLILRQEADRILRYLQKSNPQTKHFQKILERMKFLQSLFAGKKKKLHKQLLQAKYPISGFDPEWGYLSTRISEFLGESNIARAFLIYQKMAKLHPRHVRVRLRLYKIYAQRKQLLKAEAVLKQLRKITKNHIPTLLLTFQSIPSTLATKQERSKLQKTINKLFQKYSYPLKLKASWYFLESSLLWKQRNFEQALLQIERAVRLAPKLQKIRWQRIHYYLLDQQYKLAQEFINKEGSQKELEPQLLLWQYQIFHKQKNKAEMAKFFEKINSAKNPTVALQYTRNFLKGQLFEKSKSYSKAIVSYKNSLSFDSPFKEPIVMLALARLYIQQKNWKQAQGILKTLQMKHSKQLSVALLLCQALFVQKKLDEAFVCSQKIKPKNPAEPKYYILQARILEAQKKPKQALSLYEKALIYQAKKEKQLLLKLGDLNAQQKQLEKALNYYEQCEKLQKKQTSCSLAVKKASILEQQKKYAEVLKLPLQNCKSFKAMMLLGRSALQEKQINLAKRSFRAAGKLNHKSIEPALAMAMLYRRQNPRRAIRLFQKALRKNLKNKMLYKNLLALHKQLKNEKKVVQIVEQALREIPQEIEFRVEKAHLLLKAGKREQALQLYESSRKKEISKELRAEILEKLAQIALQTRKSVRALRFLKSALKNAPKHYELHLQMAFAYTLKNQKKFCRKSLRRYQQLVKEPAYEYLTRLRELQAKCKPVIDP